MKRLLLAIVLVVGIGGVAAAKPAPRPGPARETRPIPREPKHNLVWKVMNYFVVPAAKAAVADAIKGAICAAF